MKIEQRIFAKANEWEIKINQNLKDIAQLVLVFGNRELLKEQQHFDEIEYLNTL